MNKEQREKLKEKIAGTILTLRDQHVFTSEEIAEKILQEVEKVQ